MHSFFVEIVAGIETVARSARGYGLLLCSSNEDPAQGARRSSRCSASGRWTASCSASANASGNTDLLQQLGRPRHRPRDDRPRRSSRRPRATASSPTTRKSAGWRRRISSTQGAGRSRTSPGRRSSTPSGAPTAIARALQAHGAQARAPEWIVRGGFMEADGYRAMKKLLAVRAADRRGVRRERSRPRSAR